MRAPLNRITAAACLLAAAVIAGGGILLRARHYQNYDRVFPGVSCQGVSLSGMTYEEAGDAIDAILAETQFSVTLQFSEKESATVFPAQTVSEVRPGEALEAAWSLGREDDSLLGPWRVWLARKAIEIPLNRKLEYDRGDVSRQVAAILHDLETVPTDCTGHLDEDAHRAVITLGHPGRTFDPEQVTAQVCQALDCQQETLALDFDRIPLDQEQLQGLLEDLAAEGNIPVLEPEAVYDEERETTLLSTGNPGYSLDVAAAEAAVLAASEAGDNSVILPFLQENPEDYDLTAFHDWLKRDPQENYYYIDGALVGGTPGYDFDLAQAEEDYAQADYGETVEIPLEVTQPQITRQWAEWGLFRHSFGTSNTNHTADSARTTNLRLACAALDGTIINPGQEFSFNAIVGERTAAKGYQYGTIYSNQGNESQIGGGICQVATGCYQAALMAGMEITERHVHMYSVSYCPGGLDATVYWGSLDVKFRNPWTMPVRLNASVSGGQVHVSIDGTNFWGYYIRLSSEYLGGLSYRAYRTVYRPDGTVYFRQDLGVSSYSSH